MKRWMFMAALLIVAVALYMTGFSGGGLFVLALAVTLEIWFWLLLFKRKARNQREATRRTP
jgi:hypothetical protein